MRANRLKFTVAGVVLIGSLAYLTMAMTSGGWVYHLTVDQFLSDAQYRTERVRVCGTVDSSDFSADSAQLLARFALRGDQARLRVVYHGVIPDLFKPGRQVEIEGKLDSSGVFQADVLMTKCASKYQSEQSGSAS